MSALDVAIARVAIKMASQSPRRRILAAAARAATAAVAVAALVAVPKGVRAEYNCNPCSSFSCSSCPPSGYSSSYTWTGCCAYCAETCSSSIECLTDITDYHFPDGSCCSCLSCPRGDC